MMKRYAKYKPSAVRWLLEIPTHWEMSKAKYYFQYTTGFTPPTGVTEFYNGDITWVTIADMNQKVVFDSESKLSQVAIDRYNPDLTLKGSLLYSFKLSVGKVAYAGKDLYTNEAIISILPNEEYDVRYFYYTLPEQLLQTANENIYGAKMLNQELIRNASVCFPPKEEQTAIANYLDEKTTQIDTLITNKQKLIELLKEERTAVINQAVTKGINPKAKLKPSGIEWLGDIPAHWEVKKLKYVLDCFDNKRVPLNANERGESEKIFDYYGASGIIDKVGDYLFDGEFILIGEDGANLLTRSSALSFKATGKFWVNNHAHILKPKTGNIDYFTCLLESIDYAVWVSGSAQPKLTSDNLMNILICEPPIDAQEAIVQHIQTGTDKINLTISKIEKEIELLQEYRTVLISEVVTGKIKVI